MTPEKQPAATLAEQCAEALGRKVCPACAGYGEQDGAPCWPCAGTGVVKVPASTVPSEAPKKHPELAICTTPCACWTSDAALGHDGHCCFLRDTRDPARGIQPEDWRNGADEYAPPESAQVP